SNVGWNGRIAFQTRNGGVVAENNIALDTLPTTGVIDGKSVAAALLTQRYFEHTLGWDFQNVWDWDAQERRPTLRHVGVNAAKSQQERERRRRLREAMRSAAAELLAANLWA
ncbi:MAG: hypothetical protein N2688_16325, partial [Burkholderiaceae bacterium]|nr:hypothetical protein [Burkholderiaceae bacterium]